MTNKLITAKILKQWNACSDGAARFNELFPNGADLRTASDGLIADGHPDWSNWLWSKCKSSGDDEFVVQTTATAGDEGTAIAGYKGTATAGYKGTATAGDEGTATAGNYGTATAGNYGTATAGYKGTATAGDEGTATAGNYGTATAGNYGTATAGDEGIIIITYWNGESFKRKMSFVGKDCDLKPGVAYKLDDNFNFVEASKTEKEPA